MEKEKKKKGGALLWVLLFIVFVAAGFLLSKSLPGFGHTTEIDTKTLTSELVKISELATYQEEYRAVVAKERDRILDKRYYATYDGVIKAGIDMEKLSCETEEADSDSDAQITVRITMPPAGILSHSDENWEVVYEDGYQGKVGDERNQLIKEKKAEAEARFIENGGLEKAEERAREVIEDFVRASYGSDVSVMFSTAGEEEQ